MKSICIFRALGALTPKIYHSKTGTKLSFWILPFASLIHFLLSPLILLV